MKRGINRFSLITSLSLLLILFSCNSNIIFNDSMNMNDETWKLMDIATFKVPVTDTIKSSNVMFTVRNGSDYPFRNIFLFVSTTSPDGKTLTDTLQYNLADESGKWYGRGFGDIHELKLPYKSNVYFPRKGIYTFKIRHGMRIENLKGIYDFGLRIEKIR